jgi:superfamily II DNA/RNA helicase
MSKSFKDFQLNAALARALDDVGYVTPTEIQVLAIPLLLGGSDLIGISQTGTGKTLAFLIPILQRQATGVNDPQAVIVCPTRELAIQVGGEAEKIGGPLGARTVLAYGGTSSGDQKRALVEGCDILVATPGRLLDFLNSAWLSLRSTRFMVLDEADRMLDMGFIDDVDAILRHAPMSRQTVLFSATFPDPIRELSKRYMFDPQTVRASGAGSSVKDTVEHLFYPVPDSQRVDLLLKLLEREQPYKALVFCATRALTSTLPRQLRRRGHEVASLSSLLSQTNRERTLTAFRNGDFKVLVATDVAARGLDITDIDLVVNFDIPMQPHEYVHRIGRTGRAHRSGKAITLVTENDGRAVADIERLLGYRVERVSLDGFPYQHMPAERGARSGPRRRRRQEGGRSTQSRDRGRGGAAPSGNLDRSRRKRSGKASSGDKG